eukprot:928964_1
MDSGSAASGQSDCQATTSPMLQLTSKNEYSCATTLQQLNASTHNQIGLGGSQQLNDSSQIPQQSSPPQNPIKNAPPANYVCHNCNVMGHWIHKCPLTTPPANYVCHRCGVPGHWIKNCPTNGHPAFDNKPHLKVVKVRENGVNDMASTSSNAQPQEEKSTHGELKQQGSKSPQQIVIAKTNYITKNDHELALNNGDEIIVSNHIRIDSMDINRFCFCKNPLKRYKNKRKYWQCRCCNQTITNETCYHCGQRERCYYAKAMGYFYQICAECFNTRSENVSDKTTHNDFMLIKIRTLMKRMSEICNDIYLGQIIMDCSLNKALEAYIFGVFRGLYVYWIKQLRDTAFGGSKQHKMVLNEFDSFYGALLAKLVTTRTPSQKMVTANTDCKGLIAHELTFNKKDKIMILFGTLPGDWMLGKLDKNGCEGMVYSDCIYVANVNKMCYCMKPLRTIPSQYRCASCCKEYPQR